MQSTREPDHMTNDQRIQELARLFATAILRLQAAPANKVVPLQKSDKSLADPLDVPDQTRLNVTTG